MFSINPAKKFHLSKQINKATDQQHDYSAIVAVAMPVPLRRSFDFLVTDDSTKLNIGARVWAPFGARKLIGVIVDIKNESDYPLEKLRPVIEIIDDAPLFEEPLWKTLNWLAQYYLAPIGEVVAAALPINLRSGKPIAPKSEKYWSLTDLGVSTDIKELSRASLQKSLVGAIQKQGDLCAADCKEISSSWRQAIIALEKKGWVKSYEKAPAIVEKVKESDFTRKINLSDEQRLAVKELGKSVNAKKFVTTLLLGVTGSGKTEVYFETIRQVLGGDQQVLILVPEIGLTSQLIARIRQQFNVPLVVLHSELNNTERHTAWWQAKQGEAKIILGTRSAVFASFADLGLIVVDEEQDSSLKQQDGVRYHARDIAVYRAKQLQIPIILGSATPSLETYANAKSGRYELIHIRERATQAQLPRINLLDLTTQATLDGLSLPMVDAIKHTLSQGQQVILFLNRRGFAPVLFCADCRKSMGCHRCDSNLTVHRQIARVRCHHCGYEGKVPANCKHCNSSELHDIGEGTQRIEQALELRLPKARILRIDRDSTTRKGQLDDLLEQARRGDADILLGTQLLTKGHDFPNVTMVGVLNADQGLYSTDFRSSESLFQQVLQVAGRAGRRDKQGQVLIQTAFPEHPFFNFIREHNFEGFAEQLLEQRKMANFPPYGFFAVLHAESTRKNAALQFLNSARNKISVQSGVSLMDVIPSPMERRAGRFRAQLLLCATQRSALNVTLSNWLTSYERDANLRKLGSAVRWNIDIDPLNLF